MQNRIKDLRKALGLTQAEFGARICVKANTITNYETGLRNPSDAVVNSICKEFNVNEAWLRTGEGEMFRQLSRNEELAKFFGEVSFGSDDFKKKLLTVMSRMSVEEWEILEKKAWEMVEEMKKADP